MQGWRTRSIYWVLLPAIAAAAGILSYYAFQSAAQFAALGEQSIVQSTLALVNAKVARVEELVINGDNAVFELVDLETPEALAITWGPFAERISPSVRAVLVLDMRQNVIAYASRDNAQARARFLEIFEDAIRPDLELQRRRTDRLGHLHRSYEGNNYLISYKAVRHRGRRYYLVAYHTPAYLRAQVFPALLDITDNEFNVVDVNNRLIYGRSLSSAGDYLVGRRFPTTFYGWRLQVAPEQAPLLEARRRSGIVTEIALVGLSFIIILLGVTFLIYAATKENRLNVLRTEFIANVSHELKTPLSVVRMFAEMLLTQRVRSPEKEKQYLEIICRESERLSTLIENVLDFAAIERGKQTYEMREGDLTDLVQRAIDTFRFRLEQDGLDVEMNLEESLPTVRYDEQALLLAIINLLDNAVKYGGSSGPIEVKLSRGRRHVYFRVRDHGPGIPEDEHRKVFERFYRVRRNSPVRGSGIGLSLVRRIIEAHGGRAWVENAEGGGAAVSLSLPLNRARWTSEVTQENNALRPHGAPPSPETEV